jgi:protein TonB
VVKKESTQVALETRPSPEVPIPKEPEISAAEQIATKSDKMTGDAASTKDGTNEVLSLASKTGRSSQGGETEGAGGLSATPDYNVNPKPPYPLLARRIGAQGEVLLRVLVRPDGSVAAVELARSSGFSLLDESATRTVRDSWRFIPARLDGAPVESWVEVPIKFVLADS